MSKEKAYIGDAVYIQVNDFGDVILTTEDGFSSTNTIVLEPQVMRQFMNYLDLTIKDEATK